MTDASQLNQVPRLGATEYSGYPFSDRRSQGIEEALSPLFVRKEKKKKKKNSRREQLRNRHCPGRFQPASYALQITTSALN